MNNGYSILSPGGDIEYHNISETTLHDLGLDQICSRLSHKEEEQRYIAGILGQMTANPDVTEYRCQVFRDIYGNKAMREQIMEILDRINFLRDYGSICKRFDDASSVWDLMHRLDEIRDYISCVEALKKCLEEGSISSRGLLGLKAYVEEIYRDHGFGEMKADVESLNADTSSLKSITIGVNLNERFEAEGIGLISANNRKFVKANILNNFADFVAAKEKIKVGNDWDGDMHYHPVSAGDLLNPEGMEQVAKLNAISKSAMSAMAVAAVPDGDPAQDITRYMDHVVGHMLTRMVKNMRDILNKYITVSISDITGLIPEFMYYIRWAEYIEELTGKGMHFCEATVDRDGIADRCMSAKGIYNMKLAANADSLEEEIVTNDLIFDSEHRVYILTGANRGGKTTITQAIGQLYVLAQGGVFVPGEEFIFAPTDSVWTHFPADEDKTMDLGRLGEECKRFREIYEAATASSLILLNETFSTTSFEEGYYIARDAVRAILKKGTRTIYNTHMHKLALELDDINGEKGLDGQARSLIVVNDGAKRSYKVEVAAPSGRSYAQDIASKYGVTYEMLTGN